MAGLLASKSRQLYDLACEVLATGVSSGMRRSVTETPLYFERAEGPYFYDVDGNRLVDYTLGWGPLIVGSNHPHVNQKVAAQLKRGYSYGAQCELEIKVANQIVRIVPGADQVIFASTGTEAVQAAIRIARAHTGRDKVVKFEGHYHGWMNNVLVSYHPTEGEPFHTQPTCKGQPQHEYLDTLVLSWNDTDVLAKLLEDHADEIACVIAEPLLANSGCCEPREGYLRTMIELCRQHGIVSIFDEVITGFRLAPGGAREYYGVVPDLSVYGKAVGGGFPLSVVAGKASIFDVLRDGRTLHAGTYNGHPVNLAAASATLDILTVDDTFDRMRAHGKHLRETLQHAADSLDIPMTTSGAETVFSIHWGTVQTPQDYRATMMSDASMLSRFRDAMLTNGVYLLPDGRWYVGATHDDEALDLTCAAIVSSVRVLRDVPHAASI